MVLSAVPFILKPNSVHACDLPDTPAQFSVLVRKVKETMTVDTKGKAGQHTPELMEIADLNLVVSQLLCIKSENNLPGLRMETQMDATCPIPSVKATETETEKCFLLSQPCVESSSFTK